MSCKSYCAVFSLFLIIGIGIAGYLLRDQIFNEINKLRNASDSHDDSPNEIDVNASENSKEEYDDSENSKEIDIDDESTTSRVLNITSTTPKTTTTSTRIITNTPPKIISTMAPTTASTSTTTKKTIEGSGKIHGQGLEDDEDFSGEEGSGDS